MSIVTKKSVCAEKLPNPSKNLPYTLQGSLPVTRFYIAFTNKGACNIQ